MTLIEISRCDKFNAPWVMKNFFLEFIWNSRLIWKNKRSWILMLCYPTKMRNVILWVLSLMPYIFGISISQGKYIFIYTSAYLAKPLYICITFLFLFILPRGYMILQKPECVQRWVINQIPQSLLYVKKNIILP